MKTEGSVGKKFKSQWLNNATNERGSRGGI